MAILSLLLLAAAGEPAARPDGPGQGAAACPAAEARDPPRTRRPHFDPIVVDLDAGGKRTAATPPASPARSDPAAADASAAPPAECGRIKARLEFGPHQPDKRRH